MTSEHATYHIDAVISEHHQEIRDLISELEGSTAEPASRRRLMDDLAGGLSAHLAAEEEVLYPAIRRKLHNGNEIADRELAEHDGIVYGLKYAERMATVERRFDIMIALSGRVRRHFGTEEEVLPILVDVCTHEEVADLGRRLRTARKTGPTHPHPEAPRIPPVNWIVDPALGAADRIRDVPRTRDL